MNKDELRKRIEEIAYMEVELERRGGFEEDGELYESIMLKQEDLLEELGLPDTPANHGCLHFNYIPWDKEIDDLINLLYDEIEKQKNKDKKSDLELLIDSRNQDPMFILPQLGITTHVYTVFVYENIFMPNKDEPENVLSELKMVNNDSDLLNTIGKMDISTKWLKNAEKHIASLEKKGLKYIRQYSLDIINDFKSKGVKVNGF